MAPKARSDMDVEVKFRLPSWMKERAQEIASAHGKGLSEWLRDLVLDKTGPRDDGKRGKGSR